MKAKPVSTLLRLCIVILAYGILFVLLLLAPLESIEHWGWDIAVFRAGSNALIKGKNPYIPANIHRFSNGAELATIPYYVYSPFFGFLIAPVALLSPWLAFRLWFIVNIFLYVTSVVILLSALNWQPHPKVFIGIAVASAAFAPLRTLLGVGQSGVIMLFFLVQLLANQERSSMVSGYFT